MKVYGVFEDSGTCLANDLIDVFLHEADAEAFADTNNFYYVKELEVKELINQ